MKDEDKKIQDALKIAYFALNEADGHLACIRDDWTDPRYHCRKGRSVIAAALEVLKEVLPTNTQESE